jgi:hypothetical protein
LIIGIVHDDTPSNGVSSDNKTMINSVGPVG